MQDSLLYNEDYDTKSQYNEDLSEISIMESEILDNDGLTGNNPNDQ